MGENYLFIGDIAGQYKGLMRLLKKCPDFLPICVGDMVDRGPDSKKVLNFFMKNGKSILGNHEHMLLDYGTYKYYDPGIWESNGGNATLKNFKVKVKPDHNYIVDNEFKIKIPDNILTWLSSLPLYMEFEGEEGGEGKEMAFVSHAAKHPSYTLEECCDFVKTETFRCWHGLADYSIIWNRTPPKKMDNKFQIFGHNGFHCFVQDENLKDFAVCIDASRQKKLMAMVWPSREIIQVEI